MAAFDYGNYTQSSSNIWGKNTWQQKVKEEENVKDVPVGKAENAPAKKTTGLDSFTRTGEVAQANYVKGGMKFAEENVMVKGFDADLLSCIDFEKYPKLKSYLIRDAKTNPEINDTYIDIAAASLPVADNILKEINLNSNLANNLRADSANAQRMEMPEEFGQMALEEVHYA